jgi:hypothetical protein
MASLKGDRLIVNLGASQARKRLKGFGCGVRKVQTGGKEQAVIIHTAKGVNLQALKNLFADVGYQSAETQRTPDSTTPPASAFVVGDTVLDVNEPERGLGTVTQDLTLHELPAGTQCLVVNFEQLGKVIIFTSQRALKRVT